MNAHANDVRRFGNLMARSRRDARQIIAASGSNLHYRLSLVGERLIAAFDEIDASTTLAERVMLIGANPADARDMGPGRDSMLHLLWAHALEWSAMRRGDEWNDLDRAPLYWCVSYVMLDYMGTDEAKPSVDEALRRAFGMTFEDVAKGSD